MLSRSLNARLYAYFAVKMLGSCLPFLGLVALPVAFSGNAEAQPLSETRAETHQVSRAEAKSFAVFVVRYDRATRAAHGGVAGTAFFTSRNRAITAYHVLQTASFKARSANESVQVWLVHEGEPAIELEASDLRENPKQDLTVISLDRGRKVKPRYVFGVGKSEHSVQVRTEGFYANSIGPTLALAPGGRLEVKSVPKLKRLNALGTIEIKSQVSLMANDVKLQGVPCLRLSYQPIVGLSGGPVISESGEVIAMNSFAEPDGQRPQAKTWAVIL